jgi:hypothetical protein
MCYGKGPKMSDKVMLNTDTEKEKPKSDGTFEFLGKVVRPGSKDFVIDNQRILIRAVGQKYYRTNGDPDASYICFRFIHDTSGEYLSNQLLITHKAFEREAKLWEAPVTVRYVTLGQLMDGPAGTPCEEGCRVLYHWLMGSTQPHWNHFQLIMNMAKYGKDGWDKPIKVQDLYDWYKANYGMVPSSYLRHVMKAIGGDELCAGSGYSPESKSYALTCRMLGIKQ